MKKKLTTVMFRGTKAQEEQLLAITEKYRGVEGALMPVLQEAQEVYGYLPKEVQKIIARELKVSLEEVYGVVSFYSQFTLNPKGEVSISVCMGTACYVKGANEILERISKNLVLEPGETSADGKYSIDSTRCIGACGLAPVITINNDVYGRLKPEEVDGILEKYKS